MKFFFISPFCLLRPSTNRIFDVRFCDRLALSGMPVTLYYPYYFMRENMDENELVKNYGILNSVQFSMLKTPLTNESRRWWQLTVLLTSFFFLSVKIIFSNRRNLKEVFIISRDNKSLLPAVLIKKILGRFCGVKIVNTIHEVKDGKLNAWIYQSCDGLLVTTASAKEKLTGQHAIPEFKIERLVAPVAKNNYSMSREEARKKINYYDSAPLVVYTGKLGKGLGEINYILEAASLLPDYHFILSGGKEEVVVYFKDYCEKKNIRNVMFPGFINDSSVISRYQLAADVLVSYYTKKDHEVEYNFPQKLVEYMHTGNPIVTPDFPATHDVINSSNAIIVEPDNVISLAEGIKNAIENKDMSRSLAAKALTDIQKFADESRTETWMNFFKKI